MASATHIRLPIVEHDGFRWAAMAYFGRDHEITGESSKCLNDKYSFRNGHRVRLYKIKKQVYWKIPSTVSLDITDVPQRRV
jgi:hypothetical protein